MTFEELEAQLEADYARFNQSLGRLRAHVTEVAANPVHTPEQRTELHRDALSSRLGPQMREIAEKVEAGETTWSEVFEGTSPVSDLLEPHLTAMEDRYAEDWKTAIELDPDFEPLVEGDDSGGDRPDSWA